MSVEEWVPQEALSAWNLKRAGLESRLDSGEQGLYEIDEKAFHRYGRASIRRQKQELERIKLTLKTIPKLFTAFENGLVPKKLWELVVDQDSYTVWEFVCTAIDGFVGPLLSTETMTAGQRQKWKTDVRRRALELYDLVGDSKLNNLLEEKFFNLESKVLDIVERNVGDMSDDFKSGLSLVFSHPPLLTTLLYEIQEVEECDVKDWCELRFGIKSNHIELLKPNDPDAMRTYFARRMTDFFVERTGEPNRFIVETLIRCLFGEIDRRKLIQIAPSSSGD